MGEEGLSSASRPCDAPICHSDHVIWNGGELRIRSAVYGYDIRKSKNCPVNVHVFAAE